MYVGRWNLLDDDYATTRKKKPKRKKPHVPCHHYNPKLPSDPLPPPAPLPIYRKELKWIAKHCTSEIPSPLSDPTLIVQPLACMMFSSTSSDYSSLFPPLEPHIDSQRNVVSQPFIPSPITSTGHLEPPKPFESVLNWQTQNARAQNDTLLHLNSKVEHISLRTEQIETKVDSIIAQMQQIHQNLHSRIAQLDSELRAMLAHRYNGPEFDQKEREIRRLKAELAQIESEKQRPTLFPTSPPISSIGPTYPPFASMLSLIKQYDPSKLFVTASGQPEEPKQYEAVLNWQTKNASGQNQTLQQHGKKIDCVASQVSQTETKVDSISSRLDQIINLLTPLSQKQSMNPTRLLQTHSKNTDETSTDSKSEYTDITGILMVTETADPSASTSTPIVEDHPSDQASQTNPLPPPVHEHPTKLSSASWFTFDDIPRHKWSTRLQEFAAWIDLHGTRPNAQPQAVLREFMARSTGSLRDWIESLGEYRQIQFMESPIRTTLNLIHEQFIGEKIASTDADRKEYHQMKCCSLKRHLLDAHYKRMSILFYKLNGFNEPSLKHVFIASLPSELQPDLQRKLTATNLSISDISFGKIFQMAMLSLDKICEQKEFFKDLMEDKKSFFSGLSQTLSQNRV
ncbi:hypothetical protein KPL71_004255 [Citrus sinensis]|uniref:Uncharacterized protein n=1 Tax=Citrus sinensis TaxID=2711 RepID=A0ACB8N3S4_CITSI|nr:hypothetical protein KPL71_004255 [Citrus sinensis]